MSTSVKKCNTKINSTNPVTNGAWLINVTSGLGKGKTIKFRITKRCNLYDFI
jgi:hypothetical protein